MPEPKQPKPLFTPEIDAEIANLERHTDPAIAEHALIRLNTIGRDFTEGPLPKPSPGLRVVAFETATAGLAGFIFLGGNIIAGGVSGAIGAGVGMTERFKSARHNKSVHKQREQRIAEALVKLGMNVENRAKGL